MDNMMNKQDLVQKLQEIQFYAVDLNLFLDTHPNDTQAVQDYNYINQTLMEYKKLYCQSFGPLMNFGHCGNHGNTWLWVDESIQWPWEGSK